MSFFATLTIAHTTAYISQKQSNIMYQQACSTNTNIRTKDIHIALFLVIRRPRPKRTPPNFFVNFEKLTNILLFLSLIKNYKVRHIGQMCWLSMPCLPCLQLFFQKCDLLLIFCLDSLIFCLDYTNIVSVLFINSVQPSLQHFVFGLHI